MNRYDRIADLDFSAGDAYWQRTGPFWQDVRAAWAEVFATHDTFTLLDEYDGKRLFERLFDYADGVEASSYDRNATRDFIHRTVNEYVRDAPN